MLHSKILTVPRIAHFIALVGKSTFISIDCLKEEMKNIILGEVKILFGRCSSSWLNKLTEGLLFYNNYSVPCNKSDGILQTLQVMNFFTSASMYANL